MRILPFLSFLILLIQLLSSVSFVIGKSCGINKKCVPYYLCNKSGNVILDGYYFTDERRKKRETLSSPCLAREVCCNIETQRLELAELDLLSSECASSTYSGYIRGGSKTHPGKNPFLTALVHASNAEFFCGGSLITNKHVLTAAHCIQQKGSSEKTDPEDILVLLGRHNLALRAERSSEIRNVEKIIVHEKWKFYTTKYDADIAILFMDRSVTFSHSIRPICITNSQAALNLSEGTVVRDNCLQSKLLFDSHFIIRPDGDEETAELVMKTFLKKRQFGQFVAINVLSCKVIYPHFILLECFARKEMEHRLVMEIQVIHVVVSVLKNYRILYYRWKLLCAVQ